MTARRAPAPPQPGAPAHAEGEGGVAPELLSYLFDGPDEPAQPVPSLPVPVLAAPHPPAAPSASRSVGQRVGDALVESRLAGMGDASVRASLAQKLCRLLPDLPPGGADTVTNVAVRALEQLARDHITRVREALATSIKDVACAPPTVVRSLARDVERTVAEPVLRCCAALTDEDLLDIVASAPAGWALSAIARRHRVGASLADAIAGSGDADATGVLLDNNGAVIAEATLETLVEESAHHPEWQEKLARRPALPRRLAVRLADFIDLTVVEALRGRTDYDDATVAEIAAATRRRIDWADAADSGDSPERRAVRLHRQGKLNETALGDALSWNETGFVHTALTLRARVAPEVVERILTAQDPHAVTALVWRAGFSMRCAMQIQARAAGINPRAMLNARQGRAFPLSAADMTRHLIRYGVRD
ncbi:DUF2336 domain-containing protein [Azospirillum cavernae]|uniref:DUF2336 domain-containing protein n=1 Tax=Azospirillum cavernae TaxID=2320860 RepID=A0A418VXK2_9PROT|nr:DUF2336 domain-containing protein [Azospirillum cavernae]RJF81850.1 DUF2336 domain-containing protein [Azospirillum cavernae]